MPLPKVMVFNIDGDLVTTSNIDGNIEKSSLNPLHAEYNLVYDNFIIGKLRSGDLDQNVIRLREKIVEVEPVVIKNNAKAKYLILKGNFNSYVFVNNKLNSYTDGIVTFIFDNKTKKLKSSKVQEYRVFDLVNPGESGKNTSDWDYKFFLEIPDMKNVVNMEEFRSDKNAIVKEVSAAGKDVVEVRKKLLQDKEFSLFGYRFFDSNRLAKTVSRFG